MRSIAVIGVAAFLWLGCEKLDEEGSVELILVEAPTRLPYVAQPFNPQPYETTAVRFVARLHPPQGGVDSILCVMADQEGWQIDSFALLDDGGQIPHWDHSTAESVQSLDSIAGDGLYTRGVYSYHAVSDYGGQFLSIRCRALQDGRTIAETRHQAATWAPWVEVSASASPPDYMTFCDDSATFDLQLRRDSVDQVVGVRLGYRGGLDLRVGSVPCVPLSGDTLWRGYISPLNYSWTGAVSSDLYLSVETSIGYEGLFPLSYRFEITEPAVDLGLTADTVRMTSFDQMETLLIEASIFACLERGIVANAQSRLVSVTTSAYLDTVRFESYLNDCGILGDSTTGDGHFACRIGVRSDGFELPQHLAVTIRTGYAEFQVCDQIWDPYFETRLDSAVIVVLPPQ